MRSVFFPHLVNGPFGDPALYVRIAHRREAILFDCGDLHLLTPRERLKVRAVFITHGHIDHLIGFDRLLRQFLYQDAELLFCGPPGFCDLIAARLRSYNWNLMDGYPLRIRIREWGQPNGRETLFRASDGFRPRPTLSFPCPDGLLFDHGHWRVRATPCSHADLTSLAFVLEEPRHVAIHPEKLAELGLHPGPWLTVFKDRLRLALDLEHVVAAPRIDGSILHLPLAELARRIAHLAPGMKIAYASDISPTAENLQRLTDFFAEADLLAIEAVFAASEYELARSRNHLTAALAGSLGRAAGVARLLPFHHSPRYHATPERLRDEALCAFAAPKQCANAQCTPTGTVLP